MHVTDTRKRIHKGLKMASKKVPTCSALKVQTQMVLQGNQRTFIVADIIGGPPFEKDGKVILIEWVDGNEKKQHIRKYSELVELIETEFMKILYPQPA